MTAGTLNDRWHDVNAPGENPFPGLRPFEERDNVVFFGRDTQIEALLERLGASRFISVVGTSASGKSSLVRAGLLPALHGGMAAAGARWRVAVLRPGNTPVTNLAVALESVAALGSEGTTALRVGLAQAVLEGGERGLIEVVDQSDLRDDEKVLIFVDQFEELFRFEQDHDAAAAFVKLLLAAATEARARIYVLLTMRSDFLGDCARFRDLPEAINDGLFLVPRLTRDELREAIAGPVGVAGGEISPLLVNRLLNEVGNVPDQLPVLQHALMRTWDLWLARGTPGEIGVDDFEATGGLAHALSQHADSLYLGLPKRLQPVAERVFKALTDSGTDERGIRRATPFTALPTIVEASEDDVRQVVDEFRGPGRSFLMPPSQALDEMTIVDIAHESLMRVWERLHGWVLAEAESALLYRRLSDTAQLHAKGQAALLVDPQLSIADEWRRNNRPNAAWGERYAPGFEATIAFLDASLAERERQRLAQEDRERRQREEERRVLVAEEAARRAVLQHEAELAETRAEHSVQLARRTRGYLYAVSLVAVVAVALGFLALFQRNEANAARLEAQQSRAQVLASDAADKVNGGDAVTAMLLAVAAMPTPLADLRQPYARAAEYALEDAYANQQEEIDLLGHTSAVISAVYSPDGRRIASASDDKTVCIWDAASGSALRILSGHADTVRALAYSPDGKRVASASDDKTVRVWDVATGKQLAVLPHGGPVYSVAFSPNGRYIVTGSDDVRVWDARRYVLVAAPFHYRAAVNSVAFSPDGSRVVSGSADGTIRIWNARTHRQLHQLEGHQGIVTSAAFSPDGKYVVSASYDHTLRIWNAASGAQLEVLQGHGATVSSAAFSPDGRHVVSASVDETIGIWDPATAAEIDVLRGHDGPVSSAAYAPNGRDIVSASYDGTVRIWTTAHRGQISVLPHAQAVESAAFSPDGRYVATASDDRFVRVWDTRVDPPRQVFAVPHDGIVRSVFYSRDGLRIVSASDDGTARVWNARTGTPLLVLRGHTGAVNSAAFSPDGRRIVSAANDKTVRIWDARTGTSLLVLRGHADIVYAAEFSPDGRRVVSASYDKTARIWDARSGATLHILPQRDRVFDAAYSLDGRLVVTASADRTAIVWYASSGKERTVLRGHADAVNSAAFSPDGKRVVTASADRTVRIWDVVNGTPIAGTAVIAGTPIAVLRGHAGPINSAAYAPNGQAIVSASDDATARLWSMNLRDQRLIDRVRTAVLPPLMTPERQSELLELEETR